MSFPRFTMVTVALLNLALLAVEPADAQRGLRGISMGWADSYSIGGRCYCQTTFDHNIGSMRVGSMSVREACAKAGSGPQRIGNERRKYYNTVNCGNRPYNNAWDETACPGRVDLGKGNTSGCKETGPSLLAR